MKKETHWPTIMSSKKIYVGKGEPEENKNFDKESRAREVSYSKTF